MVPVRQTPTSSRPAWRWTPWVGVLLILALVAMPLADVAAESNTAATAIPIDQGGAFNGTVSPTSSLWFRFNYQGGSRPVSIAVSFATERPDQMDVFIHASTLDGIRREEASPTREGNLIGTVFEDADDRTVYVEVRSRLTERFVSFVGLVAPGTALEPLPAGSATPGPAPATESAVVAVPVAVDGQLHGVVNAGRTAWWKFQYVSPGSDTTLLLQVAPNADDVKVDVYTGSDPTNLQVQGSTQTRQGNTLRIRVNRPTPQVVHLAIVNNKSRIPIAYSGVVNPVGLPLEAPPTATPTPVGSAEPSSTPVAIGTPQAAPAQPRDTRYFTQTGYRVDNDAIWNFFNARGAVETFGFPVSRTFWLLGCQTQIFQRQVATLCPGGNVQLLNLLDPEVFPYTRVNNSTFPGADQQMKDNTPRPTDPGYATAILDFVRANAPDTFQGQTTNFGLTFFSSVTAQHAGVSDPGLLGLFNLEIWGAPISRPMVDPANNNFIYQRFQRGIMHYTAGQGTRGILLADYLKQILLGRDRAISLPADLAQQAQTSRFYTQYCPGAGAWVCRPEEIGGSDLTFAFEPS